jgi:hypothetical protein
VWRVVVPRAGEARIGETGVIVESARTPGASADQGGPGPALPGWMPDAVAAWHARAVYLIPVGPLLPAPVPALMGGIPQ